AAPVLLVVRVRLTDLAVMDVEADRHSVVGGASIYPFAHNILLAGRNVGLGGTLTTFLARQEAAAKPLLGIPDDHAIAAVIALGFPERPVRRLTRRPVEQFAHRNRFDGPVWPDGLGSLTTEE
nr:nitroreductase family protein [Micromonospora sp. DSM 115978]